MFEQRHLWLIGAAVALLGCSPRASERSRCADGVCDQAVPFSKQIEDRHDPIAEMFRSGRIRVADDGTAALDYRQVVRAMAAQQGCSEDSISTFIISDHLFGPDESFPRLISVVCSQDQGKAAEFFINTVSEAMDAKGNPTGELEERDLELFAWDETHGKYNFYATHSEEDDARALAHVEVEPARCQQCHLTPSDTDPVGMPMTPIMNEIRRPWTHWNGKNAADQGFESHRFELEERFLDDPDSLLRFAMEHWRAPASDLEQILRFGAFPMVSGLRMASGFEPPAAEPKAALATAMGLLRPAFCTEQVNYVSEQGTGGLIFAAVALDPVVRDMVGRLVPDAPWSWVQNDSMSIPDDGTEAIHQIPVRGWADVTALQLAVANGVITPRQALRAAAIDWQHPASSQVRCDLWRKAYQRFEISPPDFAGDVFLMDATGRLFEEIMQIDGVGLRFGDDIVVLDGADDLEGLRRALSDETLAAAACDGGFCLATLDELGSHLERYYNGIDGNPAARTMLRDARAARICHVTEEIETDQMRFQSRIDDREPILRFMSSPALPDVDCE